MGHLKVKIITHDLNNDLLHTQSIVCAIVDNQCLEYLGYIILIVGKTILSFQVCTRHWLCGCHNQLCFCLLSRRPFLPDKHCLHLRICISQKKPMNIQWPLCCSPHIQYASQECNHRGDQCDRGHTLSFRYLNPTPTKGGRFSPPSQILQLIFSGGYVPDSIFV